MIESNLENDADLLRAYIEKNDSKSLSLFFEHQSNKFYRIAFSYLHNDADVEDVLQTTFITIMEKAKSISPENIANDAIIMSWCIKIIMNTCRLKLREGKNRNKRETVVGSQRMQISENSHEQQSLEVDEKLSNALDSALKILPEKYRVPIHLRYIEKMEFEEISNILMEKPGTIRVQLKRGLEKLGIILKEKGIVTTGILLTTILSAKSLQAAPSNTSNIIHKVVFEGNSNKLVKKDLLHKSVLVDTKNLFIILSIGFVALLSISYFQQKEILDFVASSQISTDKKSKNQKKYTNEFWDFSNEKVSNFINYQDSLIWQKNKNGHSGNEDQLAIFGLNIAPQDKSFGINSFLSVYTKKLKAGAIYRFVWTKDDIVLNYKLYQLSSINSDWDQKVKNETFIYKNYIINAMDNKVVEVLEFEEIPENSKIICVSLNFLISSIKSKTIEESEIDKNILEAIQSLKNKKPIIINDHKNILENSWQDKF